MALQTVGHLSSTTYKGDMPTTPPQGMVKLINLPPDTLVPLWRIFGLITPDMSSNCGHRLTPDDEVHWIWSLRHNYRDVSIWNTVMRDMIYNCLVNFKQAQPDHQRKDLLPSLHQVGGGPLDRQPRTWLIVGYEDGEEKLSELLSCLTEALGPYLPELQWGIMVHNHPASLVDHNERLQPRHRMYINTWARKLLLPLEYVEYQTRRLSLEDLMMEAGLQSVEEAANLVAQIAESEEQKAREKQYGGPLGALLGYNVSGSGTE